MAKQLCIAVFLHFSSCFARGILRSKYGAVKFWSRVGGECGEGATDGRGSRETCRAAPGFVPAGLLCSRRLCFAIYTIALISTINMIQQFSNSFLVYIYHAARVDAVPCQFQCLIHLLQHQVILHLINGVY